MHLQPLRQLSIVAMFDPSLQLRQLDQISSVAETSILAMPRKISIGWANT